MSLAVVAVLLFTGCASYTMPARAAFHPTKPMEQQEADHAACWAFAKGRTGYEPASSAASGAAIGGFLSALAGAALGAALGAATGGSPGTGAAIGATAGIPIGAAAGATEMQRMHDLFTKQYSVCMRAKGYVVE